MATPHVTAAAALALADNPGASVTRVRNLLTQRAAKVTGMSGKPKTNEYGYGLLDLAKLLR
jgi:subtilisin family serine protease